MGNFVNIIGYQLEKVHTGVIKWLLEVPLNGVTSQEQYDTLSNIYDYANRKTPFLKKDIIEIKCMPEFSFGRRLRIDLVIEIITRTKKYYLVCEMKVDSDPYTKQLDNTVELANKKFKDDDITYLLILIGSSSVARETGDKHKYFITLDTHNLIEVFSPIKDINNISNNWIKSLEEECKRNINAVDNFKSIEPSCIWDKDKFIELGYRPYFSLYYYLYSHIRKKMTNSNDWKIYSGSNNPVMNWQKGWRKSNSVRFYWEFNYLEYCFKVNIDKNITSKNDLNKLRDKITPVLDDCKYKGKASQRRYGNWNTIYKWKFSLHNQSAEEIVQIIENDIHPLYDKVLKEIVN